MGDTALSEFTVRDADRFVRVRRKTVKPATVNRGLAVLKNMLNFAAHRGYLNVNPLRGYKKLPEEGRALQILTVTQERALIEAIAQRSEIVAAFCALLGEPGLRKGEALNLKWEDLDWSKRRLTVTRSKSGDPRYVPLSSYAQEWLQRLQQHPESPFVFAMPDGSVLSDPRYSFDTVKKELGLGFVKGFHDLRHYRATQWLARGVDVKTVSRLLGHRRIETTMRYLHLIPDHADRAVRRAKLSEIEELTANETSSQAA
jgi:integrase